MTAPACKVVLVLGLLLAGAAATTGCGHDAAPSPDAGPMDSASWDVGGGGGSPLGDVAFPWPLYNGTVPDVAPAVAPARTWYCDPVNGNDAWDGASFTFVSGSTGPKKTLSAALAVSDLGPGDVILLGGGIYRERPTFNVSGSDGALITIGSYGHGTGAPILDGGLKPNQWSRSSASGQTTVWQTSTSGLSKIAATQPVLGVYVNTGKGEYALREVPHGQLTSYEGEPLPASINQTGIKDNSNNWYFDPAAKTLYADFGGTLGKTGDPNQADISILYNSLNAGHEPLIVLWGVSHLRFVGLTIRAASWHGVYAEASHITFERCDVKFNGGGGIFFGAGESDVSVVGNTVVGTRIWMNVLENWPRFNNGNTGGGWPGALSWFSQSDALAQGNVVYQNGGEGLILWGTNASGGTAHRSVNNVVRQNVIYDNWSINLYLDNTQNARIEQNFAFNHPRDARQTFDGIFTVSNGYNMDWGKRMTPANLSLADEPGSAFDGHAHLSNITVVNNIFAGGKFGFLDYDDGTTVEFHGLKNSTIANNTVILGSAELPGQQGFGWRHLFLNSNQDSSQGSLVQNNVIVTAASSDAFVDVGKSGAVTGITCDYNLYAGPGQWLTAGTTQSFSAWKQAHSGWDQHSIAGDAGLGDLTEFSQPIDQRPVYDWSKAVPSATSAALGAGVSLPTSGAGADYTVDFTGASRRSGAPVMGALDRH